MTPVTASSHLPLAGETSLPASHRCRPAVSTDPARPATRRTHCGASYRTRSAARLDRSAQPPGALKSDPRQRVPRPRPGLFSLSALISRGGTASMPVRENRPGRANSSPARPVLWSPPGSHLRGKPGLCACGHGRHLRDRLAAGAKRIRTTGPPLKSEVFRDHADSLRPLLLPENHRETSREGPVVRIRFAPARSQ